ncbi:hypothetical protein AHiyo8_35440 [Arthrobacter sp. Hiyo8]|nr:hypothetical protein AHiyo8_35440 [Arthrobacter sp. Hiyo8]
MNGPCPEPEAGPATTFASGGPLRRRSRSPARRRKASGRPYGPGIRHTRRNRSQNCTKAGIHQRDAKSECRRRRGMARRHRRACGLRVHKTEDRKVLGQRPRPWKKRLETQIGDGGCHPKGQESMDRGLAGLTWNCRTDASYGKPELALGSGLREVFPDSIVPALRPPGNRPDNGAIEPRHVSHVPMAPSQLASHPTRLSAGWLGCGDGEGHSPRKLDQGRTIVISTVLLAIAAVLGGILLAGDRNRLSRAWTTHGKHSWRPSTHRSGIA